MADTPSRKRAWRNAAAPAPASPPVEAAWRSPQSPARQGPRWWKSRRFQLGFVVAAVLAVLAGIKVVIDWWRPPTPFVFVAIYADYADKLFVPPNVEGRKGADELISLAENEKQNWSSQAPIKRLLDSHFEGIEKELENKPEKVVVFVTAHGVARIQNDVLLPYLVRQDDDLHSEDALYPLDRLLDALAKLPDKTPKLLLLDVTGVGAHWPLGQLHNDFARALKNLKTKIDGIPNLVVISSSDEDQRSWTSPEWGQTCFAHYVIEGLKGSADQKSEKGDGNGRVDAGELFYYVQNKVKSWVWHNRARPQTPVLFGSGQAKSMKVAPCGKYQASDNTIANADDEGSNQAYEALKKAWEDCWKLRKTTPHPAAYAPHLWRRYLDTLLRVEQLWRSGDEIAAKNLLADLDTLQEKIKQARSPELESAKLTLAMPAALGMSADEKNLPLKVLTYLQRKPGAAEQGDKDEVTKELAANVPRRRMVDAALTDALFRKVAADPKREMDWERWLLEFIDPKTPSCRSAEAHYLMMLTAWRSQGELSWPLVQQSLRLRRVAEQAALGLNEDKAARLAAYSEQVLPWIQSTIEKADEPRRLGQDLLFASSAEEWNKAKKLFDDKAQPDYVKAQEIAVKIRRALDVRDRLYSELPYYTHWIAERGSAHEKELVELWNDLHELRPRLELQKPVSGEAAMTRAAKLDKQQQRLAEGFKKLHGWLEEIAANKENPSTQNRWHEIEAALAVPFLEPATRRNLIRSSRDISRELFKESPKQSAADIPSNEAGRTLAQESVRRQGRLALAMLSSDDWPQEYAIVKNALEVPEEGAWYRSAARAGQGIGRFLNQLPEKADEQCEEAAQKGNLGEAAARLRTAARYARTIQGAAALTRMTRNPVDEQRRLRWHDLLCWQAHRTFLDWWAELGQTPQTLPYFQRAGTIFLKDAEQLVMGRSTQAIPAARSPRLERVYAERANLQPLPMIVERSQSVSKEDFRPGPAEYPLTDEDNVKWSYRLMGPKGKVPGYPVKWVNADRGLRVAPEDASRRPIAFNESFAVAIAEDYRTGRPPGGVAKHHVWGFFRGHRSEVRISISMPVRPDRVVSLPPLSGPGHVAVQTKKSLYDLYGAKNTAIALVLDLSGSMIRDTPRPNSRFDRALGAMRSVLERLPKGVTISLRTFGDLESIKAGHEHGIRLLWPARSWDRDDLAALIAKVEKLEPWGYTPLVRSIAAAKKDLPGDKIARSIVVITDGGDSTFYKDDNLRPGDTIKSFLRRQFANSDIQVSVIGFEAKESELLEEEKKGYREFRPALQAIQGQYYDADNTDLLTEYLARSLLHMYFQVSPDPGRDVDDWPDQGENISQSDKNWRWVHLKPERYRIRVPSVRSLRQRIELRRGDALLLDLVSGLGDRPEFRRGVYAESDYIRNNHSKTWPDKSQKDWLLSVLQNQQEEGSKELQLMASLEKYPNTKSSPQKIQQIHPGWVWFEVPAPVERRDAGPAAKAAPTLRITSLPDYPADAWGLDVSGWPIDRPAATLKTWWIEHFPRPSAQFSKGPHFETPLDPRLGSSIWLDDSQLGRVVLEGVELKRMDINVEGRVHKDVSCLVVRLSYPRDKEPFFVRFSDNADRKMGVEDRFYTQAGKYTGIFWSVSKEDVQNIDRLDLFSVAALKKESLHVDKLELAEPNDRYKRPDPVGTKTEEP